MMFTNTENKHLVFSSTPGYVCCLPTHRLLQVLSVILLLIMVSVFILNITDYGEINLGFWVMHLFILGTFLFIGMGVLGTKKLNAGLVTAASVVWFLTYAGFLLFVIYSMWRSETIDESSINGRCPMTLWLFDWCCKARGVRCKTSQTSKLKISTADGPQGPYVGMSERIMTEALVKKFEVLNSPLLSETKQMIPLNLTEIIKVENATCSANLAVLNNKEQNTSTPNTNITKLENNQMFLIEQEKRSLLEMKVADRYPGGSEYRASVAALLGILSIMGAVISIYTLYAVALYDILNVLKYPPPVIFIARMPEAQEQGATNPQEPKNN